VVRQQVTDTCEVAWLVDSVLMIATGELVVEPGVHHIMLHKTVLKVVSVTYLNMLSYLYVLYIHTYVALKIVALGRPRNQLMSTH
jgi:hypothetical protein